MDKISENTNETLKNINHVLLDFITLAESRKFEDSWYEIDLVHELVYIWITPIYNEWTKVTKYKLVSRNSISKLISELDCCYSKGIQKRMKKENSKRKDENHRCIALSIALIPDFMLPIFTLEDRIKFLDIKISRKNLFLESRK